MAGKHAHTKHKEPRSPRIGRSRTPGANTEATRNRSKYALGGALLLVVVIAAVAFFTALGELGSADTGQVAVASTPPAKAVAPASAPQPVPTAPEEVALNEVFTFRDIFEPLVQPTASSGAGAGGSTAAGTWGASESSTVPPGASEADGSGSGASENSLLLQDIAVEDGQPTAILVFNGQTYNAQQGDQIGDSAWQLLYVEDNSAVMLYGESQVVLSEGQEIAK